MRLYILLILAALATKAGADGHVFKDGRFQNTKVTVFDLTATQKQIIGLYRKCRSNHFSPYVFRLTEGQAEVLKRETGTDAINFYIVESIAGDLGAELAMNPINRFSEGQFEIPHRLLSSEAVRKDWDENTMGWAPSPLAAVTATQLNTGTCPTLNKNHDRQ